MADYCDRNDLEDLFGITNVIKWADLDNDTAEISATLSTRTDADSGILTVASGHGVTVNDALDVFWTAGKVHAMSVTAQDATTITIDGGSGDALPVVDSPVGIRLSAKITARITRSITEAMADVDSHMKGGPYTVPLAKSDSSIPTVITRITTKIAGVWLYENRGVNDYDAEKRTAKHRLSFHKEEAYRTMLELRARTQVIDAVSTATTTPSAHDYYTEVANDTTLKTSVRT